MRYPTHADWEQARDSDQHSKVRELLPRLDWHTLWEQEDDEEWLLYPLIPARRLIALFSPAKVGKSLLMLEIAAALSTGKKVLGHDPGRRVRVLYIDFENDPRGDVRTRLQDMGYEPGELDRLDYLSFPSLPYLDSEAGASSLLAAVEAYGPELVVIDTISRAVGGEENDNDTWLNLYKHTGVALKRAQVAMIRLDHTGKDETKGMRGGSAKAGDLDAIWKLSTIVKDDRYRLECIDARFSVQTRELTLIRHDDPTLHHSVEDTGVGGGDYEAKVLHLIEVADRDELPDNIGRDRLKAWAKGRDLKAHNTVWAEVIKRRKNRKGLLFTPSKPVLLPSGPVPSLEPVPEHLNSEEQVPQPERKNLFPSEGNRSGTGPSVAPVPFPPLFRGEQGTAQEQNGNGRKHEYEPGILCEGGCGRAVGAAMALAGITTHPECS